jgi:hypothetical protein
MCAKPTSIIYISETVYRDNGTITSAAGTQLPTDLTEDNVIEWILYTAEKKRNITIITGIFNSADCGCNDAIEKLFNYCGVTDINDTALEIISHYKNYDIIPYIIKNCTISGDLSKFPELEHKFESINPFIKSAAKNE